MGYKNNDPCWDKAAADEPIFVLLGRDVTAATVVEAWADLNGDRQPEGQVQEAVEHARRMRAYCERLGKTPLGR